MNLSMRCDNVALIAIRADEFRSKRQDTFAGYLRASLGDEDEHEGVTITRGVSTSHEKETSQTIPSRFSFMRSSASSHQRKSSAIPKSPFRMHDDLGEVK
jgi:hypothetical protein